MVQQEFDSRPAVPYIVQALLGDVPQYDFYQHKTNTDVYIKIIDLAMEEPYIVQALLGDVPQYGRNLRSTARQYIPIGVQHQHVEGHCADA